MEFEIEVNGKKVKVTKEVHDAFVAEQKARKDAEDKLKAEADAKAAAEAKAKKDADDKAKAEADAKRTDAEKIAAMKEENEKLQARVDSLEEKVKTHKDGLAPEEINKAVKARLKIEQVAKSVLGEGTKIEDKADLEVMKEVIAKQSPNTDLKDKSEVYVRARFDAIAEEVEGREERRFQFNNKGGKDTRKDEEFDSEAARKRNQEASKETWKQPLAATKK